MKYLFIHPNFPAQYKHILKVLASKKENQVIFICDPKNIFIPGVRKVEINFSYKPPEKIHRYIASLEKSVYRGQAIWRACHQLKSEGFTPDIVCAHPGWGDALFLKDIFPDTPLLNYLEFYYNAFGADVHFDPRQKVEPDTLARIRIKNANNLINLEACDWGISPTKWQANQNPKEFRQKISVIHEGIDTDLLKPKKIQGLTLPDGTKLKHGDKIITYIARNLEPYRGFPSFMKTVEILNKEHKDCHVIIVGNDGVSYGAKPKHGTSFKEIMLKQIKIDNSRVHFLGYIPHSEMIKVLLMSTAHVYLTVPFVLSWSMLEAMALECLVIGSDTAPVKEIIKHNVNGLLVDFFSPEKIAEQINKVFKHKDKMLAIRKKARKTIVEKYALKKLLPLHLDLISSIAKGQIPPLTKKIKARD